jgi:site-specific DNA-methyltransferase (adenine-specific)
MDFQVVDKIEMRKISEIKPYFRNPRKNEKTVEMLVDLIPRVGFNVPILIDEDGVIVKGHARYRAAIRLGLDRVPCVITQADEEAKKLDRLADNKVSELSEWVNDDLLHELDMLTTDFDLSKLGFPSIDLDDLLPDLELDDADKESEEEKRARYQAFLDSQPEPPKELITSQASIDSAAVKQQNIPEKPKKYYKVICEKCGHVMFVTEGDANPLTN